MSYSLFDGIWIVLRLCRAVNYMALARGPAADYDEWADLVGDESWKWKNILPLMREVSLKNSCDGNYLICQKLEDFDPTLPSHLSEFAAPKWSDHGAYG